MTSDDDYCSVKRTGTVSVPVPRFSVRTVLDVKKEGELCLPVLR